MRKLFPLMVMVVLFGFISIVHAQVEVQCLPMTEFVRGAGDPVLSAPISFPGIAGPATLKVYNGAVDGTDTTERVSSSKVLINGTDVLGPENFNSAVSNLQTEIVLNEGQNTISVELRSKPGGKIRVEIVQMVEAEAAGFISPSGGIVEVSDPSSLLYKTKVYIPEDAVENYPILSIEKDTSNISPPNDNPVISEPIEINCTEEILKSLLIVLPVNIDLSAEDEIFITYYDENRNLWGRQPIFSMDIKANTVSFIALHLTTHWVQKFHSDESYPSKSSTGFNYYRDRFNEDVSNSTGYLSRPDRITLLESWFWSQYQKTIVQVFFTGTLSVCFLNILVLCTRFSKFFKKSALVSS